MNLFYRKPLKLLAFPFQKNNSLVIIMLTHYHLNILEE